MGFEERFSKVGRALDEAKEKVRLPGSAGEPLVDKERVRERYDAFKTVTKEKAEHAWEVYQGMPKAKAAAYALGGLCAVLAVAVVVLLNSGPGDAPPSKAKANEIATMAALRAKLAPPAGGAVKPKP
ncbi:MAG TPA: hypothetical protein VFF65_04900 [Phycisphaerales bacterium]|nr:hypothetical protein [Phycisphaerales bacterium]